jgi:hypothetical protein
MFALHPDASRESLYVHWAESPWVN